MSTTLTNGLKLPDKGSVDWYADMQSNYAILDGAVGTIAEHTTALTGKAPLVHIHTKSDITDFPVYGNTAGTICEGNDSRLSDARTPVAHTHGKADITDLFNSANTWSGDNTYTTIISYQTSYALGNPSQSAQAQQVIRVIDIAGTNYLAQIATYQDPAATGLRFTIRDKFDSNGFSPSGSNRNKHFYFLQNTLNRGYLQWEGFVNNNIYPLETNAYDLGSSSYQWNNIYSKQYYGENVLITKNNTPKITIVDTRADRTYNATQTEESACRIEVADKDNILLSRISTQFTTDKRTKILFTAYTEDTSGNQISKDLMFNLYQNDTCSFNPGQNNAINLGSSSYQWNNLYAKNYYYNGVAWGLDKANTWTGSNTFTSITTKTNVDRTVAPTSDINYGTITCRDKNGSAMFRMQGTIKTDLSNVWDMMLVAPNSTYQTFFKYTISSVTKELRLKADSVIPDVNSEDLGTSTNKWKSLNGINPGALSIFNPSAATQEPIDIPNTWVTDGSAWNTLNVSGMGDGWICITYRLCGANDYILARFSGTSANVHPSMLFPATMLQDSKYYLYVLMPVAKAMGNIYLEIKLDNNAVLVKHSFMSAYGTV